jgi:alpha-L-fucosidase
MFLNDLSSVAVLAAFSSVAALAGATTTHGTTPPAPYGVVPSERQLLHTDLETYAFLHFSPNTFTNREWGNGDEDPDVFNPDKFDPDQIVLALKAGGMKGAIVTAKHHDGFCLWQTKTTDHGVAKSKWMDGKGDVVRALSDACKRHGLKFGVYLSPWDRNNAHYGKPEYPAIYREQLRELLTNYGPLFEIWHDGANGGTGYYGGAREDRSIDRRTYYGWPETWAEVRQLQPGACIFSDVGPDYAGSETKADMQTRRAGAPSRRWDPTTMRPLPVISTQIIREAAFATVRNGFRPNATCPFDPVGFGT